jgi:three-Cys-motif partner protein
MTAAQPDLVGPWVNEKLDALGRYLDYYTKVLKNQPWRTIYIDGFAGAGRAALRGVSEREGFFVGPDAGELKLIDGSPRVALGIANPFDRYVFIEPEATRAAQLQGLRTEFAGSRQIDVLCQDARSGIEWVLSQNVNRRTHRGVVFLDPFGANLDWSIVQVLAASGVFEVVINFALHMAIQRMLPNSGEFQSSWRKRLDAYFGTPDWYSEVYASRMGLLGRFPEKRGNYLVRLLRLYRNRLREAFGYVADPRLIRNTHGSPLYYLLWAGPHPRGLNGANYILRMGEHVADAGN